MSFKKLGKMGMKTLAFVLAFIMAVPVIFFVSAPEEALASSPGWGRWTPGRTSVTMNGITAEVVAWNDGGGVVTRAGYTSATVAGLPGAVNTVGAREMLVRVSGTMYRYVTNTIDPVPPPYGRTVTRVASELPLGSNVLVYARAHNGGLHVGNTAVTATMRQTRDIGPMTSIANLGRDGRTPGVAHNAAAWRGFAGYVPPRTASAGGNTYVIIGFPTTFTNPANANTDAGHWVRNTHFPAIAGAAGSWGFTDVVANGQVRLYMGIVSDSVGSNLATAPLTLTAGGSSGGTNLETVANPGFIVSGGAGNYGFRNNIMSVNGLAVRASHRRLTPNSATISYRLEGIATQPGNYTVWFTTNGAMFGNGRHSNANHNAFPTGGNGSPTASGPWGEANPPRNTYAIAANEMVVRSTTWEINMSQPAAAVLRIEFAPFPSLGDTLVRNTGVAMNASGALNAPAYQVRLGLDGAPGATGNHRVTLYNIPAGYNVAGQTVLTDNTPVNIGTGTASDPERPALTGATARRIEWIVPVTDTGNVSRDAVFNVQQPGVPVNQARANALTGILQVSHEFFPNAALAAATDAGVTAGGAGSSVIFNPDTGQVRVTVPFSGNAPVQGRFNIQLTSTNPTLNAYLAGDVRSFNQPAGAVTRAPMVWNIEQGATIDVASLGLAVVITADIEAPPVSIGDASNRGVTAVGTARVGADQVQVSTLVTGTANTTGAFRVRVLYRVAPNNYVEVDSRTYRLAVGEGLGATGRTFMTSLDNDGTFNVANLSLDIAFLPVLNAGPVSGVSAEGNITLFDDDGIISVSLSGTVAVEGFYRVGLTGQGFVMAAGAPSFQMERFARDAQARGVMSFDIIVTDMTLFADTVGIALSRYEGDRFFFAINYVNEEVTIGNAFTIYQRPAFSDPDPRGRRTLVMDNDGMPVYEFLDAPIENILRQEISFIFNRRADRIDVNRGNWIRTGTGVVDVNRQLRRGAFMGVRRRLPNGTHELIAVIPLDARPCNRAIRAHRRDIFAAPMLGTNNVVETAGHFQNPEPIDGGAILEVRIGNDRQNPNSFIATERLAPGQTYSMPHDLIPRGARGTYRIAPTDIENFVVYRGNMMAIRDVLARYARENYLNDTDYVPQCDDGNDIVLGTGNFGSAIIRFRIPNAPVPPAVARMQMTPGRNGAPFFISATNANMFVNVGTQRIYDGYVYVRTVTRWEQLDRNIPLAQFLGLFVPADNDTANNIVRSLPATQTVTIGGESVVVQDFEIRILRAGRVQSAPGFLRLPVDAAQANLNPTARILPIVVEGIQNNIDARAPLTRNGINVIIETSNGLISNPAPANGDVVGGEDAPADNNWFPNLPAGLTATINQVAAGGSRIRVNIRGVATVSYAGPIQVVIPEGRLVADAAFPVPNEIVAVPGPGDTVVYQAPARFNITGDARPIASGIAPVAAVDVTHANATAGTWGLPATVALEVDPAPTSPVTVPVVWDDVSGFDSSNDAAQSLTVTGTVAAEAIPNTVQVGASFTLPAIVTVTVNVAAND